MLIISGNIDNSQKMLIISGNIDNSQKMTVLTRMAPKQGLNWLFCHKLVINGVIKLHERGVWPERWNQKEPGEPLTHRWHTADTRCSRRTGSGTGVVVPGVMGDVPRCGPRWGTVPTLRVLRGRALPGKHGINRKTLKNRDKTLRRRYALTGLNWEFHEF